MDLVEWNRSEPFSLDHDMSSSFELRIGLQVRHNWLRDSDLPCPMVHGCVQPPDLDASIVFEV